MFGKPKPIGWLGVEKKVMHANHSVVFLIHPEGDRSAADGTGEPGEGFGEEWKRVIVVNENVLGAIRKGGSFSTRRHVLDSAYCGCLTPIFADTDL